MSKEYYLKPCVSVFKYDDMKWFMYHIAFYALSCAGVTRTSDDGWCYDESLKLYL